MPLRSMPRTELPARWEGICKPRESGRSARHGARNRDRADPRRALNGVLAGAAVGALALTGLVAVLHPASFWLASREEDRLMNLCRTVFPALRTLNAPWFYVLLCAVPGALVGAATGGRRVPLASAVLGMGVAGALAPLFAHGFSLLYLLAYPWTGPSSDLDLAIWWWFGVLQPDTRTLNGFEPIALYPLSLLLTGGLIFARRVGVRRAALLSGLATAILGVLLSVSPSNDLNIAAWWRPLSTFAVATGALSGAVQGGVLSALHGGIWRGLARVRRLPDRCRG